MAKVVLTGDGTGAHRQSCLDSGADLFLEKPRALDGWQVLCATIEQLTRLRGSESGFRGMLRQVELQDVLQMECLARSSSILEIKAGSVQGRIYIQDGAFVHSEVADAVGEEAFNRLLALNRGEFSLHPFADPPRKTIDGPWEFVLMEAARKRDEMAEPAPQAPPAPVTSSSSWTGNSLPLEIAPLPTAELAGLEGNSKAPNSRPRIDEVLLCSPRADVLYEWRSHYPEKRVHLMNLLQHKAAQLAESLPLGPITGLDIEGPLSRFLFHLKPDYFLFVRSTRLPLGTDKTLAV
jgi:hypothetical protein